MKRFVVVVITLIVIDISFGQTPLVIGDNREIFIDDYLIARMRNVNQVMHDPKNEGIVLHFDKPWEGNFSAYCTVIKDGEKFKIFYRGVREAGDDGNDNEV